MKPIAAVQALTALAHETRLGIFRVLVKAGFGGMPAGKIADTLDVAPPMISFHMKELLRADLVTSRAEGRFVYYAANYSRMNALLQYLTDNCCSGNPELCAPMVCSADSAGRKRTRP